MRRGLFRPKPVKRFGNEQVPPQSGCYGALYETEAVPDGLSGDPLRGYLARMSWYHSIDFGHGVVSSGVKPLRVMEREWELFAFEDLRGRSLLDIGGVDGAYAFRAERAGASPWRSSIITYGRSIRTPTGGSIASTWRPGRRGLRRVRPTCGTPSGFRPRWRFDTARQLLGSNVQAITADFTECDLSLVGTWDVVLMLGVLYHMEDPLKAMRRVSMVTRKEAIVETEAMIVAGHTQPLCRFFPNGELNHDRSNWWVPNLAALLGLIRAAGFRSAEVLSGEPTEEVSDQQIRHYRAIVRATK